jgi:uncharacterized cupin superfamily protein
MGVMSRIEFGMGKAELQPAPIPDSWILEGKPFARNLLLSRSEDGAASTLLWDCTAGRFHWHYSIDETVYILEGSVIVRDENGDTRRLTVGDTAFFPCGTSALWTVESYVRKLAFCRVPLPAALLKARRLAKRILVLLGLRRQSTGTGMPAMFGGS